VRIFVDADVIDEEALGELSLRRVAAGLAAATGKNRVQRNVAGRVVERVEGHRVVRAVVGFRRDELAVEVIRDLERGPFTADDVPVVDFAGKFRAVIPASQRAAGEYVQVMVQDAARRFARILRAHVIIFVDVDFPAVEEGIGRSVRAEPEGGPPTGLLAEFHPRLEVAVSEDLVGIEAGALGFGLVRRRPVADDFQQSVVDFGVVPFTRGAEVPFAGIDLLAVELVVKHLLPARLDGIELRGEIDSERRRRRFRFLRGEADDEIVEGRFGRGVAGEKAVAELDG